MSRGLIIDGLTGICYFAGSSVGIWWPSDLSCTHEQWVGATGMRCHQNGAKRYKMKSNYKRLPFGIRRLVLRVIRGGGSKQGSHGSVFKSRHSRQMSPHYGHKCTNQGILGPIGHHKMVNEAFLWHLSHIGIRGLVICRANQEQTRKYKLERLYRAI